MSVAPIWRYPKRSGTGLRPLGRKINGEPAPSRSVLYFAGRSITYGALLYFGEILGGLWASIIIQSLIAAHLIFVFIVRVLCLDFGYFLLSLTFLLVASPLPFFASFLMPDIFAGFLILLFAIMAIGFHRLSRFDRAIAIAVSLFAVLAHVTHPILFMGLTALTALYVLVLDNSLGSNMRSLCVIAAACALIAVAWELMFSVAVERRLAVRP